MLSAALVVALVVIAFAILYLKLIYSFWKRMGVVQLNPKMFIGDFYDVMIQKASFGDKVAEIYNVFKSKGIRYGGAYFMYSPMFVPVDPDIIKSMLLKDSHHFVDRGMYYNEEIDPLSAHLFSMEGEKWRFLRTKLSPTFTSGKMKTMFPIVAECGEKLVEVLRTKHCSAPADVKEILACFTTDVIATCAFGIECDSMNNPKEDFRKYGRKFVQNDVIKGIKTALMAVAPEMLRALKVSLVDADVAKYFLRIVKDNLDYRRENGIVRPDFFNLLIQLKNKGEIPDENGKVDEAAGLSLNELAAQAFIFFLGGFETSSTTMTFAMYEMARNLEIQDKLRREINTVLAKYDEKVCYEALQEMPYLEAVINESLRRYPPLPQLNRICTQDYRVPNTDITLKKGVRVVVSVKGLHMDPEYYPNPEVFDPERFHKNSSVPCTFLPFGDGPRICIGMRFGLMQSKIGLISLIRNYEVKFSSKTEPVRLDPKTFTSAPKDEVYLDFKKL